jgi:hypothetical protein
MTYATDDGAAALGAEMRKSKIVLALIGGVLLVMGQAGALRANDYPTVDTADYVFGCMVSNGQTRRALEQCACSIDVIASLMPYERYVEAETIIRMSRIGGEKSAMFKNDAHYKEIVANLKRAQVEAELRCF